MSLLDDIRSKVVVDLDSMDPEYGRTLGPFQDMTSNQAIAFNEISRNERKDIFNEAIAIVKSSPAPREEQVQYALDIITVLLAKPVIPYLKGRVHAQLSPKYAYDTLKSLEHAHRLVALFNKHGIPTDRICLKIPATGPSIAACAILEKEGIRTLATCLFDVTQAIAASQAGCLYIAPYFNELRVHFDPGLWKAYSNTAKEHPMSSHIRDIVQTYKDTKAKTYIMPASLVTPDEVVAIASFGVHHMTISGPLLKQLSEVPAIKAEPTHPEFIYDDKSLSRDAATKPTTAEQDGGNPLTADYLVNSGAALDKVIASNPETKRKLDDALKIFGEMEIKSEKLIKAAL